MATEKRLIDANAIIGKARWMEEPDGNGINCDILAVSVCAIEDAPTVDAVEVVHGRWKPYHEADIGYDEYGVRCSNCNFEVEDHEVDFLMNYCPNCGAKMDGGEDND